MRVMAFGEIVMRLEVPHNRLLSQSNRFNYLFTGTGFNILTGLSLFGHETTMFTMLPKNNLGVAAKDYILKAHVNADHVILDGDHCATYILEKGVGIRPSQVTYLNRSESSFCSYRLSDDEIEKALQNVGMIHLCGISLSTSDISKENLLRVLAYANQQNIKVAFDFNYRPRLNNDYELRDTYKQVLKMSDLVFGSERDIVDLLGHDIEGDFETKCRYLVEEYNLEVFAGTIRKQDSYQGFIYAKDTFELSDEYEVDNFDRIGTGDAFAAAMIDGYIRCTDLRERVADATIYGVLAHTTYGDSPVADPKLIKRVKSGIKGGVLR